MSDTVARKRKVTVSLPADLVLFADSEASRLDLSRSGLVARLLRMAKAEIDEQLAAEGYRYYAEESLEFAQMSAQAVYEALGDDRWARGNLLSGVRPGQR